MDPSVVPELAAAVAHPAKPGFERTPVDVAHPVVVVHREVAQVVEPRREGVIGIGHSLLPFAPQVLEEVAGPAQAVHLLAGAVAVEIGVDALADPDHLLGGLVKESLGIVDDLHDEGLGIREHGKLELIEGMAAGIDVPQGVVRRIEVEVDPRPLAVGIRGHEAAQARMVRPRPHADETQPSVVLPSARMCEAVRYALDCRRRVAKGRIGARFTYAGRRGP